MYRFLTAEAEQTKGGRRNWTWQTAAAAAEEEEEIIAIATTGRGNGKHKTRRTGQVHLSFPASV